MYQRRFSQVYQSQLSSFDPTHIHHRHVTVSSGPPGPSRHETLAKLPPGALPRTHMARLVVLLVHLAELPRGGRRRGGGGSDAVAAPEPDQVEQVPGQRDHHETRPRPDESLELDADRRAQAHVGARAVDLIDGGVGADGGDQAGEDQREGGQGRQGRVQDQGEALMPRYEVERQDGCDQLEPGEAGADDEHDGKGFGDAVQRVQVVLELLRELEMAEAEVEGSNAQLVIEHCRYVVSCVLHQPSASEASPR